MKHKNSSYFKIWFLVCFLLFLNIHSTTCLFGQTTETFTSSGTWTCPYGVSSVIVECWGGGGAGAGDGTDNGTAGAGGGAYSKKTIAVVGGTSYSYSIGAAGTAGTGNGGDGGNTTFNTTSVIAEGGKGGTANGGAAGAGGLATNSTGDTKYDGGSGFTGSGVSGGGGGGSGGTGNNGNSATSTSGATAVTGGYAGGDAGTTDGAAGNAPTAGQYGGGGGASGDRNGGSETGGAGHAGLIKITYTGTATTLTIGASSDDFTSITAARTALESIGIAGPITLEIQSDYNEAGETYPISFAAVTGASATNTITYRPASGVTALVNDGTPASATSLITFNGADYITLDGRPGGVGTTVSDIQWTIRNLRTAVTVGTTIHFTSDATYNTVKFINIEGEAGASGTGVIHLSAGSVTGNDYNSFSYCKVQDLTASGGANFPVGGITVNGTSEAISDDYITIDNCHIMNISTPQSTSTMFIGGYEMSNWTITNNHMYHSSATSLATGVTGYFHTFIFIDDGTGHTVTGNYMGGTASSCGGTAYTYSGAHTTRGLQCQTLVTGSTVTISNNTFTNFNITSTYNVTANNAYLVVFRLSGDANINLTSNTIGSLTSNGVIDITHNHASALGGIMAIWDNSTATTAISNNNIGGITINAGTSTDTPNAMIHLYSGSSTSCTVSGNTIGGISGVGGQIAIADDIYIRGIYSERTTNVSITGNTIQNFSHTGDGSFIGIFGNVGPITCTGNEIKDITTGASNNSIHYMIAFGGNTATNKVDPGIGTLAVSPTISSNNISNITCTSTSALGQFNGIYVNASGTITCSSNTIGSTTANNISVGYDNQMSSIYIDGNGTITCSNNTIQQINITNTGTATSFSGIWDNEGILSACNLNTIKNITCAGASTSSLIGLSTDDNTSITNSVLESITLSNTATTAILYGIYISTSGTITCTGNTVGSTTNNNIVIAGNSVNSGIHITGSSTNVTCSSNTIQEFNLTSTSTSTELNCINLVTGTNITCSSNTIQNHDVAATNAGVVIRGIYLQPSTSGHTFSSNTISSLNSTTTSAVNTGVRGIGIKTASTASGSILKNTIKNLTNTATGSPTIYGIYDEGSWSFKNNVILISNGSNTNAVTVVGIYDESVGTMTIYHNTIGISGSATAGTLNSRAYYRGQAGTHTIKNNLFQNNRTGGTGTHPAVRYANTTTITSDYNYLEVSADQNIVGIYSATSYDFATWKTTFAGEDNSLNGTTTLAANGEAQNTFAGANLGTDLFTGSTVTDDIEGTARDVNPWMGAFEGGYALPITLFSFSGENINYYNELYWTTATENNNDYFTIERAHEDNNFQVIKIIKGAGNSTTMMNYIIQDYEYQYGINYYRLKQTDYNGEHTYSEVISIDNHKLDKEVINIINLQGQTVDNNYTGIIFILYSDGSIIKSFKPN